MLKNDLTTGSIPKHLFQLAWPMALGMLSIVGFNIADTYFVGQLGATQLAAMSYTFPVVMVIGSMAFGLSTGLTSMVSREIGAKKYDDVKTTVTDGISLAVIIVSILSIIGFLSIDFVFGLLGAKGETLHLITQYMQIWYLNVFFVIIPMVGNGAIRGIGNTKFPALVMTVAGLVNLIFDPLLIFGLGPFPRLELQGAAIATVLSRMAALAASLYVLHFREKLFCNPFGRWEQTRKNWLEMLRISAPASIGNTIVPLSIFMITAFLAEYGDKVVAGFGAGTRLESFFALVIVGASAALGPFVGQNFGARQTERVRSGVTLMNRVSFTWIALCYGFVLLFSKPLSSMFNDDPLVVQVTHTYIIMVIFSLAFQSFLLNINSSLNAMGKSMTSMKLTTLRMLIVYVPLAFLLKHYFQYTGVFAAAALANMISGLTSLWVFRSNLK